MLLQVQNLQKSFGANRVLAGIDLEVRKGDSLVILGGSGAGKSVLVRHMAGLIKPDGGAIMIDGKNLSTFSRKELFNFRRRIGVSFQDGALFDSLTAFENVAFPIRRHERDFSEAQVRDRVNYCLELVGMPTVGDRLPSQRELAGIRSDLQRWRGRSLAMRACRPSSY